MVDDSIGEPTFWIHYDEDVESIFITQHCPIDDDDEDSINASDKDEGFDSFSVHDASEEGPSDSYEIQRRNRIHAGASDDAF